jgi:RHS repeat-associated protein
MLTNGALIYSYDNSGNLATRKDSRTPPITTSMNYDGVNRILSKTYTNPSTPTVSYTYDTGGAAANANGHLITVTAGGQVYTRGYDIMGRVNSSTQTGYSAMAYGYNLAGAMTSFTFPSGRTQTTTYDGANRPAGVSGKFLTNQSTYISTLSYWPNGAPQQLNTGAATLGAFQQYCQNSRLQTTGVSVGPASVSSFTSTTSCAAPTPPSGDTLFLGIAYGAAGSNNGNVSSEQIVTSSGLNVTQSFTYDAYNRLLTATEKNSSGVQAWTQPYLYDAWGNRAVNPSGYILNADLTPTATSQFSNNQWIPGTAYTYDGGNQNSTGSKSSPGTPANTFTYDGENRVLTADIAGTGNVNYSYDGEGRRVQKTVGAVITNYVYDANGQLVAEYSNGLAAASGTQYMFDDHLGSTRLELNGSTLKRYDYLPFGEEIPSGMDGRGSDYGAQVIVPSTPDVVDQKFTGKERDSETGLDFFGARYFSAAQGRFTSADEPLAYQYESDPQTWNLYTYGRNNPLKFVDPDGHEPCVNGVNPENGNICVVHTEKPKSDDVPLTPYAQEFYNQMSTRRQASNGLIAGFAIADAVLATTYLGTYVPALLIRAAPAAAAALPVLSGTNGQKLRQAGEFVARMEGSFQDKVTAMIKLLDQIKGSGNWNYTAMDAADGAKVFLGDATDRIRVIDTAGKVWSGTVAAMNGLTPDYSKLTPVK